MLSYKIFNSEKYECSRNSLTIGVYGEETMSIQHVQKWVHEFSNGREEVHNLVRVWKLDPQFYVGGISKLVSRYGKRLNINGNYVEKS